MRVGVVIPLANEEGTVLSLIDRVLAQITPADAIFCVLDNVSKDSTRTLIEQRSREDGRVICIWAPENRCVVDAYFRGYEAAIDAGAEFILEMDGGFSHSPEEIPPFLQAMQEGYDYAGGCRFMKGGSHNGSFNRRSISWGGTLLANALLGSRMRDMTSGFECFNRKAMELVLSRGVRSRAHFFQTEIRYWMHQLRWVEVPINYCNPSPSVGFTDVREALSGLGHLMVERFRKTA